MGATEVADGLVDMFGLFEGTQMARVVDDDETGVWSRV